MSNEASDCGSDNIRYQVILTDEAFYAFSTLPSERLFCHIDNDLGLLETTPELGREYDPVYDAVRPPFPCRVLYCEQYGIYYKLDDESKTVLVFAIEDQRRNPARRFDTFEYGIVGIEPAEDV